MSEMNDPEGLEILRNAMTGSIGAHCEAAAPGERTVSDGGLEMTATADYRYTADGLFRRFVWCSDPIAAAPEGWPRGEWFIVRRHWRDARKKAAA